MSKLKTLGLFISGALVGGVITGYVMKTKYEQIIEEEIKSVKDTYKDRCGISEEFIARKEHREEDLIENCDVEKVATVTDIKEYNENKKDGKKVDYTRYHKATVHKDIDGTFSEYNEIISEEIEVFIPPTLIDEEEVGMHGYDMKVLTYYSDGILADESDTILDIDTYIGLDNSKLFDENPGCQSMFVRNERNGIDYEIQRDDMSWSDFATQMGIEHD